MNKQIFILVFFASFFVSCSNGNQASPGNIAVDNNQTNKICSANRKYNETLNKCIRVCGENQLYDNTSDTCVAKPLICSGNMIFDSKINNCACPGRSKQENASSNYCICSANSYFDTNKKDCVCVEGRFYSEKHKDCVLECKDGEIYSSELNMCIEDCSSKEGRHYDVKYHTCVPTCKLGYSYDKTEDDCVQDCKGNSFRKKGEKNCTKGKPLSTLKKNWSILPLLTNEKEPIVCLDIDLELENMITKEYVENRKDMLIKAINIWLEPLRKFNGQKFIEKLEIHDSNETICKLNKNMAMATIYLKTPNQIKEICSKHANACSFTREREIYFSINNVLSTYMHEFGHLFGFEDAYEVSPTEFKCKDGYDFATTIMCASTDNLKPADIDGIRSRYCDFFKDTEVCPNQ
ncbi:MAG: hypothetical protein HQK49_01885 [Oligoflexia bacterium]|nr:hypothetical protein [Oligoflexia bacterium]